MKVRKYLRRVPLVTLCVAMSVLVGYGGLVETAVALPFNDDMVGGQYISGSMMRPRPAGGVPIGSLSRKMPSYEVALTYSNPLKGDKASAVRGERLFAINCSPCHGNYPDGKYHESAIALKGMPSVNLTDEGLLYFDGAAKQKPKPDGHIFGYVYFGGLALMPAYGWKLSNSEIWDIVNYVRKIQSLAGTVPNIETVPNKETAPNVEIASK